MPEGRVVDTNVLIVASAADNGSPFRPESTPVEEVALRKRVLDWVAEFERDTSRHVVVDFGWRICDEYMHKLTEQDYGWLAMRGKLDRNEVAYVQIDVDEHGHAMLPFPLADAVTDRADRKMVAAVLAAIAGGNLDACKLTNACDTDWLDCESALKSANISMENLLPEWLCTKWADKHKEG